MDGDKRVCKIGHIEAVGGGKYRFNGVEYKNYEQLNADLRNFFGEYPPYKYDVFDNTMVAFALRYCLGRRSYAPSLCQDWIKEKWHLIGNRELLIRDVELELERPDIQGTVFDYIGESWGNFLQWMRENEHTKSV